MPARRRRRSSRGPRDAAKLALGAKVYARQLLELPGAKLEGQPNGAARGANGRLPAAPHDESGHTWNHPDRVLFGITKYGPVPPMHQETMKRHAGVRRETVDENWAVLAYIKALEIAGSSGGAH